MDSAAASFIVPTSSVRGKGGAVSTSSHASAVVSGERETHLPGQICLLLR